MAYTGGGVGFTNPTNPASQYYSGPPVSTPSSSGGSSGGGGGSPPADSPFVKSDEYKKAEMRAQTLGLENITPRERSLLEQGGFNNPASPNYTPTPVTEREYETAKRGTPKYEQIQQEQKGQQIEEAAQIKQIDAQKTDDTYKLTYKNLEDTSPVSSRVTRTQNTSSAVISQIPVYTPGKLSQADKDRILAEGRKADQLSVGAQFGDQGYALVSQNWGQYKHLAPGIEKQYAKSIITLETTGKAWFYGWGDMKLQAPEKLYSEAPVIASMLTPLQLAQASAKDPNLTYGLSTEAGYEWTITEPSSAITTLPKNPTIRDAIKAANLAMFTTEIEAKAEREKDISIPRRGETVTLPGVLGLKGVFSVEQDFTQTTSLSMFGGEGKIVRQSLSKARPFSEMLGEDYALQYRKFEGKYWKDRAKSEDWIPFAKENGLFKDVTQFGLNLKTGGELMVIGPGMKGFEIVLQTSTLAGQLSTHGVAKDIGFHQELAPVRFMGTEIAQSPRFLTEVGSSTWNAGSLPVMVFAAPYAIAATAGAVGAGIGATGLAGAAAATAATKGAIITSFVGYGFLEGGNIRSPETGETIGWDFGKASGSALATYAGYKIVSDVSQGKNPLPFKYKSIPLQAGQTTPYTIPVPIKVGTKIPFLGTTERRFLEIPFFAKTIVPAKNVNIFGFEGLGKSIPLIARSPEGKFFFGPKMAVTSNVAPTGLIASGNWLDSKLGYKATKTIIKDYFRLSETKESIKRVDEMSELATLIYRKEVPIKSSIDEVGKLNPLNKPYSEYVVKTLRGQGALQYGSQSSKLQGGLPEKRLPGDFDTYVKENWIKFAFGGQPKALTMRDKLIQGLNQIALEKKTGDIFRASKESPLLVEVVGKTGASRHFVDIHTEGYLASLAQTGQPVPGTGFGLGDARRTVDIKGTKISTLGEETVAKLRSVAGTTETGIGPQAHRIDKDIGDAFSQAKYVSKEGDKFLINRIIDKITFKPSGKDYETTTNLLSSIATKLPTAQAQALANYNIKYGVPSTVMLSAAPSSVAIGLFPSVPSIFSSAKVISPAPSQTMSVSARRVSPSTYSRSISSSASISRSVSRSPSPSSSISRSVSTSPSITRLIKSSLSPSRSISSSVSSSASISRSVSRSPSPSSSISGSISQSVSPYSPYSISISPSPYPGSYQVGGGGGGILIGGGFPLFGDITKAKTKQYRQKSKSKYRASAFSGMLGWFGKAKEGTQSGFGLRPMVAPAWMKKKRKK